MKYHRERAIYIIGGVMQIKAVQKSYKKSAKSKRRERSGGLRKMPFRLPHHRERVSGSLTQFRKTALFI